MKKYFALIAAFGLIQAVHAETIFHGNFEDEGRTPVVAALVELRAADGTVKAFTNTDAWGAFPAFAAAQLAAGDNIVAYGGIWGAEAFAGEFRLLLNGSPAPQNIGAITTLVSTLAGSDQVQGSTPAERLVNAVTLLESFGLIDDDWRQGSPARVNYPVEDAIASANGIQNWVAALLAQMQAGSIDDTFTATFPYANGGVLAVSVVGDANSWLPGDSGALQLSVTSSLESAPVWSFSAVDLPAWMNLSPSGEVTFDVPPGSATGGIQAAVRVTHPGTGAGRDVSFAFRIEDATIAAQQSVDAAGGTLWHPNGTIGIEIPAGALTEATMVQWLDYADTDGQTVNLLRLLPSERAFALPARIVFADAEPRAAAKGTIGECWLAAGPDHLAEYWFAKPHCVMANFIAIERQRAFGLGWATVVGANRAPYLDLPSSLPVRATNTRQPASTLSARCGASNCAGRQPVLFIHGYTFTRDGLGGGKGTWEDLPELLHNWNGGPSTTPFAAYEFRYRSNARFEDIAADLGSAIEQIYNETGFKVRIVAHSFGGIVARTYLQGLAANAPSIGQHVAGCGALSRHPYVESLLTLGTPHAGISDVARSLHGLTFPEGEDGYGEFVERCGQLSCWQAGSDGLFDEDEEYVMPAYGMADEPGEIIAKLQDFSQYPLPVPTLSLSGLVKRVLVADDGDGLISWQGQRFSPHLACPSGNCSDQPLGAVPIQSIGGQSVGSCVYERVLGALREDAQSKPGSALPNRTVINHYRHSAGLPHPSTTAEPGVMSSHMPGLSLPESHYGSTHDSFNRALSWLVARQPEPLARTLEVRIAGNGAGAVEIVSQGDTHLCDWSAPQPCVYTVGSQATIRSIPGAGAQWKEVLSSSCTNATTTGCTREIGAYESFFAVFSVGDQATLRVQVQGPGQVDSNGVEACTGDCLYHFAPNSLVLLSRQALPSGIWTEWSGACSGSGQNCAVILGAAGSVRTVTASFATAPSLPSGTGRLNDTGIQFCGGATTGNGTCTGSSPQGQDAYYGRDALAAAGQLTKIGGGNAGFDYTKIANNGQPLPATAALGSAANNWACTRDNVTGLIWEVKVNNAAHARHMDHRYTWYNTSSPDGNPGVVGSTSSCGNTLGGNACNTQSYTQAVNAAGLCGTSDWRMPTLKELQGIVDYGRFAPVIDGTYFVNTASSYFWSGSPFADYSSGAWDVGFGDGYVGNGYDFRSSASRARLVRGGQ